MNYNHVLYAMSLRMTFQICRRAGQRCVTCDQPIDQGFICIKKVVAQYPHLYHLGCYQPPEYQVIDFRWNVETQSQTVDEARKWVREWNRQWKVTETNLPEQFRSKAVKTESPYMRRLLIEVFEYLDTKEVEVTAARICRDWFHVTRDHELWKRRWIREFHPADTTEEDSYRTKYIVSIKTSCWKCLQPTSPDQMRLWCPLRSRPYCIPCSNQPTGGLSRLSTFFRNMRISPKLAARLNFRYFIYSKIKQNYKLDLVNTILPYATQRKELLIQELKANYSKEFDASDLFCINELDLKEIYMGEHGFSTRSGKLLLVFCGTDDQTEESVDASVQKSIRWYTTFSFLGD